MIHVKNKLKEYGQKELDFNEFFSQTGIWAFSVFIEAVLEVDIVRYVLEKDKYNWIDTTPEEVTPLF